MHASQTRLLGLLLLLAGCSRDLTLPEPSTLTLADAFPSASPNERLTLQASGGAPPYRFAVLTGSGSKGPGGDPRVDAASGAYQAGSYGPAVDFVEVRDAGGSVVQARISVGPMLQVTPTEAFAAPGGRVGFVASGGKPPYTLAFTSPAPHPGTIEGTDLVVGAGGGCGGSVRQPAAATLRLVDATGTAAPELTVNVGRGLDIYPAAGVGTVAPHEAIAFLASGGQPPYQFSMAANPSGGPGIDAGRGTYAAGAVGQVTDRVLVSDANGQVACADVTVGPGLSFEFSNTRAHPGQAMKVLASGGRPPYRFIHAPKGNRSRGTLDAVTGDYVPGYNTGATDLITVADATGTPPLPAKPMTVGGLVVDATYPDQGCHVGDVDGDGRPDAVAVSSQGVVTAVSLRPGQAPRVIQTAVRFGFFSGALALGDVNLDGRTDLVVVSGIDGALEVNLGQGDGSFAVGALRVTDVFPRRVAMAGGSNRIFLVGITVGCGPGLAWYDYDAARGLLGAVGCVATGGTVSSFSSLVAGDWDGDGLVEVAYTRTTSPTVIAYRLAKESFATEHLVALPAPWRYESYSLAFQQAIEVRRSGASSSDAVLVVYDGPRTAIGTRTGLATLRGGAAGLTLQQVDRVDFGGLYNVLGLTALGLGPGGVPRLAVANGADGQVLAYDFPLTPAPLALSTWQPAARDFRVVGLCAGDLDGDGVEDLVLTPREQDTFTEVLLGEPDGGWDLRPRFYRLGGFVGDVDGDGLDDLVSSVQGLGLEVLFPSGGEFALGPATPVDGMLFAARAADWDGDGIPDLMARIGATGFSLLPGLGGGRFAPPRPVVVTSAGGLPYDPISVSFTVARLGGPSQGPDLITYVRAGATLNYAAIIFADPSHATYGVSDMLIGGDYSGVADLDGDGLDDLVAANGSTLRAALVKPGVTGATWPFLPSIDLAPLGGTDSQTIAGVLAVPGAVPPRQRVVVVSGTTVVLVEAPGGALAATPIPVSIDWNLGAPVGVADVTGDGWPDLVAVDYAGSPVGGDVVVFRGTPSGSFEATRDASLTLHLVGQVSGSILPNPAGPADLLMTAGSGYLVLHNDGLGHFR